MTSTTDDADRIGIADEDRLPWLESADLAEPAGPSAGRVIAIIVGGLLLIAAVILGYNFLRNSDGTSGTGELITADAGDYKVKPDEPGGMKVEGEGDTVFATSEGGAAGGSINTGAVPEAPVAGKTATPKAQPSGGSATVTAQVPPRNSAPAAKSGAPATAAPTTSGGGGAVVQLGSFPSEGAANTAWTQLSKRFGYLAPLGKSVERADVDGRTVFRLRVNAGSTGAARDVCGKLKVAGEGCFIPN
jgi:SPOR domain